MRIITTLALALCTIAPAFSQTPPIAGIVPAKTGAPVGSPVQIESCVVESLAPAVSGLASLIGAFTHGSMQYLAYSVSGYNVAGAIPATLVIDAVNESAKPADLVRIRVIAPDGSVGYVRDVAMYSPGIDIVHHYRSGVGISGAFFQSVRGDECSVDFVHFTDGTIWTASR